MTLQQELLDFYKQNSEAFVSDIEELDSYNGYLGDYHIFEMDELNDLYQDMEPITILYRSFFGYDGEYLMSDQKAPFNPNRNYFYFNGYGNLVSIDSRDYSDYLDEEFVRDIIENEPNLNLSDGAQEIIEKYKYQEEEQENLKSS